MVQPSVEATRPQGAFSPKAGRTRCWLKGGQSLGLSFLSSRQRQPPYVHHFAPAAVVLFCRLACQRNARRAVESARRDRNSTTLVDGRRLHIPYWLTSSSWRASRRDDP
jgi:hypothetical protein